MPGPSPGITIVGAVPSADQLANLRELPGIFERAYQQRVVDAGVLQPFQRLLRLRRLRAQVDLQLELGRVRPGLRAQVGEDVGDHGALAAALAVHLQADRQVLLRVKTSSPAASRDVVAVPITVTRAGDLRYDEWEYTRRLRVEELGQGQIGYVHLRAMGPGDIAQWARDFYPVFQRQALIVDVRHNGGGNIDSWILEKLMRKAWIFWQGRAGNPYWNMQYAFRGHVVVLCDERTGSDGGCYS